MTIGRLVVTLSWRWRGSREMRHERKEKRRNADLPRLLRNLRRREMARRAIVEAADAR